jgi:beta-1,4-N-acetylglucosaminyltransferase
MAPETPPSRSLFITVGSTLFEALTTLCLSAPFLSALATAGVEDLVVQYGKAKLDLPPDLQVVKDEVDGSGEAIFRAGGGGGGGGGLGVKVRVRVRVMRYTDDFEGEVKRASWVISHAGESGRVNHPHDNVCHLVVGSSTVAYRR